MCHIWHALCQDYNLSHAPQNLCGPRNVCFSRGSHLGNPNEYGHFCLILEFSVLPWKSKLTDSSAWHLCSWARRRGLHLATKMKIPLPGRLTRDPKWILAAEGWRGYAMCLPWPCSAEKIHIFVAECAWKTLVFFSQVLVSAHVYSLVSCWPQLQGGSLTSGTYPVLHMQRSEPRELILCSTTVHPSADANNHYYPWTDESQSGFFFYQTSVEIISKIACHIWPQKSRLRASHKGQDLLYILKYKAQPAHKYICA